MGTLETPQTLAPKTLAGRPQTLAMPQTQEELGLGSEPARARFSAGDFVWGKIKNHQWWPGRVRDPPESSDQAPSSVLVAYFGDGSLAWTDPSNLKGFLEGFDEISRSSSSKGFKAALFSAVSEIGKCLAAQFSCNCLPEKERSELAKILGNGGKISNFEAHEFLGLVRDVAVDVNIVNVADIAKMKSWVVGFERGSKLGHKMKKIEELVDKIDLDVPANEMIEGKGPEILSEKSSRGRKRRSVAALIAQLDLDTVELSDDDEEKKKEENGAISGRRERKKSKYLSPPYTHLSGGLAKTLGSPRNSEPKTPMKFSVNEDEEEKIETSFQIDGLDIGEVLSEFLATAVNPLHLKGNCAAKNVRGFFTEFRRSVYSSSAKSDAHQKELAESVEGEKKLININIEVSDKSEEGKKIEVKRGRKKKDAINGEGETPVNDKSEEGKKSEGKRGRKRKDLVNGEGETPILKSEEGNKSEAKKGRKRRDQVNGEGQTPVDLSLQSNGETPVTPKATVPENGTSGRKRGRKKANANMELEKNGQEETKGEEKANAKAPVELDINGKDGSIIDVPINLGSKVTNGSGERKPRQRKKGKNTMGHEDPAAVLLTFSPEISLPSNEDLVSAFSKYGTVIQAETEAVKESSSAKVTFVKSSDAEKAFTDKVAALGLPVASYRLRYLTGNLSSPSSHTSIPVPKPPLPYIRKSLERMISTLSGSPLEKVVGSSQSLKPETRDNLVGEMQGLLMKVDKMLTGPAPGTSA
ncbi:uncharacterized protein LOC109828971 [Asparagus officinalis]|uniref:uncharacterized protein LOC109828971 n=1 Tax=Asparagus officinalis TaxID=4686 RepID=UPI00098E17FA|nr:uncharacterized protein LOC109828971 [Asparagus officinalis]